MTSSKNAVRRAARSMLQQPLDRLEASAARGRARTPRRGRSSAVTQRDRIERVIGSRVWDSRGRPTVEAEIVLASGVRGRSIAPAGASTGINEAVDLRDGGRAFGGLGVDRAVRSCLHGDRERARRNVGDGSGRDRPHAHRARRNAQQGAPGRERDRGGVDGCAHAAAAARAMPLWRHLAEGDRADAADADGADFRRRRACRPPRRHSGFSRRADRRVDVR